MNFSNATIYRITVDPALHTVDMLNEALQKLAFVPCGPAQESSFGWVLRAARSMGRCWNPWAGSGSPGS